MSIRIEQPIPTKLILRSKASSSWQPILIFFGLLQLVGAVMEIFYPFTGFGPFGALVMFVLGFSYILAGTHWATLAMAVTFDKSQGKLTVERKSLLWPKKAREYPLQDITWVDWEEYQDCETAGKYWAKLKLASGKSLKLHLSPADTGKAVSSSVYSVREFLKCTAHGN